MNGEEKYSYVAVSNLKWGDPMIFLKEVIGNNLPRSNRRVIPSFFVWSTPLKTICVDMILYTLFIAPYPIASTDSETIIR